MWYLLSANTTFAYTHADTLRGSNGRGRAWWDIQHYDLDVHFDTLNKSIRGRVTISFNVSQQPTDSMQIDLQEPMIIDSVIVGERKPQGKQSYDGHEMAFTKEGNVWWITGGFTNWRAGDHRQIIVCYHGAPRIAVRAPWDGGFTWTTDSTGKLWAAVSCQGLGASVWWPCKDAQFDEPDSGMDIRLHIPANYSAVSNGRLVDTSIDRADGYKAWHWQVKNPINNYDATFYIGDYMQWHDTLAGEKGKLDLDFWVLRYNEARARKQFAVVKSMIHCFEYWMGPYPFYEDGYKLVDAPYLGMEHQSAVAYGNNYQMGYLGYDRTGTMYGLSFDYIIVHESGHEWFGNSITSKDIADMWVHEGITTYSESLFTECLLGKEKAMKYSRGERRNIQNDKPIIGSYGVNEEGSEDMYDKGATMLYMIRLMTNDDEKFRMMLRGLSSQFYHQTVTTKQIEDYIAAHTGLDLTAFFNQYLRTSYIPTLEYFIKDGELSYRFTNIVAGFTLPVMVTGSDKETVVKPSSGWQHIKWASAYAKFSPDLLIKTKKQE
jgi:aminopeptidase N